MSLFPDLTSWIIIISRVYFQVCLDYNYPIQDWVDYNYLSCFYFQVWVDYKLRWNPEKYGGIKVIRLPHDSIWLPDILLYNK